MKNRNRQTNHNLLRPIGALLEPIHERSVNLDCIFGGASCLDCRYVASILPLLSTLTSASFAIDRDAFAWKRFVMIVDAFCLVYGLAVILTNAFSVWRPIICRSVCLRLPSGASRRVVTKIG